MLVMFLKMVALLVVCGLAAGGGYLVWEFLGHSYTFAGSTVALLFAGFAYPITAAVAKAFESFDVTQKLD